MINLNIVPFRHGKQENYFHFWVDFYIPYLKFIENKNEEICIYGKKTKLWEFVNAEIEFSESPFTKTIRGMNPLYVTWDENICKIIDRFKTKENLETKYQIYIERISKKRHIKNSEGLYNMLKDFYPKIRKVNLENMSFQEQITLFQNANVVIGQHGAGLTNCMWCNKGTIVIEMDKNLGRLHFANMCKYLKMKHYKYDAVKKPLTSLIQKQKAECLTVNLSEFKEFIENINNEN
jgi:capsular polysaccharide biosynthesis protein